MSDNNRGYSTPLTASQFCLPPTSPYTQVFIPLLPFSGPSPTWIPSYALLELYYQLNALKPKPAMLFFQSN